MRMRGTGFIPLVLAAMLVISGATSAGAAGISFAIDPPAVFDRGTISYAGGGNALIGDDIEVGSFTVLGIRYDFMTLYGSEAILNFTTGNLVEVGGWTTWDFAGGGSITLDLPGYGNLFTGSFNNAEVSSWEQDPMTFTLNAVFTDLKNPMFLESVGLPTGVPYDGNLYIWFWGNMTSPYEERAFSSMFIFEGNITNEAQPVPEPGSIVLFGAGLVGLAGWGLKIIRKRS